MKYLLPTIVDGNFYDGEIIHAVHKCCEKYCKSPCDEFYKKIKNNPEGFYVCPSGYTVYHNKRNGDSEFYIGVLVKKHCRKKINTKQHEKQCNLFIQEELFFDILKEQGNYLKLQNDAANSNELHKDLLHDVRKLDALIKAKSEEIINEYGDKNDEFHGIVNKVKNINAMEELIACKYSVYDLASNIGMLSMGGTLSVNIYKKFDKVRYILSGYKNKDITITFIGETQYVYEMSTSYSNILPFLLMENAVKYTIGKHNVEVCFEELSKSLFVTIKSFGPYCEEYELERIFEKNYRGLNTIKHTKEGMGIGLYLVKQICDICNIDIKVRTDFKKVINGIKCGYFFVDLIF